MVVREKKVIRISQERPIFSVRVVLTCALYRLKDLFSFCPSLVLSIDFRVMNPKYKKLLPRENLGPAHYDGVLLWLAAVFFFSKTKSTFGSPSSNFWSTGNYRFARVFLRPCRSERPVCPSVKKEPAIAHYAETDTRRENIRPKNTP